MDVLSWTENNDLNLYVLLESEEKRQDAYSSGLTSKPLYRDYGPCLLNFRFSADEWFMVRRGGRGRGGGIDDFRMKNFLN